jgi:RHS repeat-associated protein
VIDPGTGAVTQMIFLNYDPVTAQEYPATYDMSYDDFGNLQSILYPPNANNQRMSYEYTYDQQVNTYVTVITDALNYTSSASYDVFFGKHTRTTDMGGSNIYYKYDHRGRLSSVQAFNSADTILSIEYWDQILPILKTNRPDSIPWAITSHVDPDNPGNNIRTVLFTDAQGKVLQTKKDAAFASPGYPTETEEMIVSGEVLTDAFGRNYSVKYPTTEPLGTETIINMTADTVIATLKTFDVLDRETSLNMPDTTEITTVYDFAICNPNEWAFRKRVTDQNQKTIEYYTDANQRQIAVKSALGTWTRFYYNPQGELTETLDPDEISTFFTYDRLGRKTSRTHPDAGITTFQYDLAGNLKSEQTANLAQTGSEILYNYQFNQLTGKVYPSMQFRNVSYEYGTPGNGNNTGRLVKQMDATGLQSFEYGPLGEVIKNRRTCFLPFENAFTTFTLINQYDVWNRIKSITYPDGEVLTYHYNKGGLLKMMTGVKNTSAHAYIQNIGYDKFESRQFIEYGNGTNTTYAYYPSNRRLSGLLTKTGTNETMISNAYKYDPLGNITLLSNNAGIMDNDLGGKSSFSYTYDDSYRLTLSEGSWNNGIDTNVFECELAYNNSGTLAHKYQLTHLNSAQDPGRSYRNDYFYNGSKPHAPNQISNAYYTYDANGNLTAESDLNYNNIRKLGWDEEDRLTVNTNHDNLGCYTYDANGERTYKIDAGPVYIDINGQNCLTGFSSTFQTLYANPYFVIHNKDYTKHYYAGSERVASVIGGGLATAPLPLELPVTGFGVNTTQDFLQKCSESDEMIRMDLEMSGIPSPLQLVDTLSKTINGFTQNNDPENDVFYYHPDHLGSSSFITGPTGEAHQHFAYFPYGDLFIEQSVTNPWPFSSPYKFNAKELDGLTGYYYYGARYYDPRISVWLGVDPKADKAPNTSPYAYCSNNPIKYIDPDGKFKTFFGAALYLTFHSGVISKDRTNGEYFVGKRNQPSSVAEPGMLTGPEVGQQRRYSWGGRSEPKNAPSAKVSEQPTISAQKDDKSYYNEKSYQARQESAKFEQAKQGLMETDAVSFGSNETGLGGVQCLYEGLDNASMMLTIEASGIPKVIPTLGKWLNKLNEIQDLPAAIDKVEKTYQESSKQKKSSGQNE